MPHVLTIVAEPELISEIITLPAEYFEMGDPQPAEALSDAADSPIGPQELQDGLQLLTLAFTTGTAGAVLISKLIDLKKRLRSGKSIRVVDTLQNTSKLVIKAKTLDDTISNILA
jgi:hypothetical protein